MKAAEVLRLYAAGRRDFSKISLKGQNFEGKDLSDADFSGADIRSTNFAKANLTRTDFSWARAGLKRHWITTLIITAWLMSIISGFFSSGLGIFVSLVTADSCPEKQILGGIALVALCLFVWLLIRKGIGTLALAGVVVIAIFGVVAAAVAGSDSLTVALAVSIAGAVAGAIVTAVAVSVIISVSINAPVSILVSMTMAIVGAGTMAVNVVECGNVVIAILVTIGMTLLGAYIGWRALQGDERDLWIRSMAVVFATIGGTSFRGAILTDADFSHACLKGTDLRRAILLRTRWRDAKNLDCVRPGETYLNKIKICALVTTGNGQGQFYNHFLNLEGINLQDANLVKADFTGSILKDGNLQGADLTNASLMGANCNGTNLQDVDLSGSKLVYTQLDEANLTGSTLTGAYIEDWNITTETKLNGIRCDYIFMRLPRESELDRDPHRKPDDRNKNFADGEFSDFIAPMVETLDLYHNQVVDPRALAISFQELQERNPDAGLEIVSMERRGKRRDQLLVRAEASSQSNLSELHNQYFERYDYLLTLPPPAIQAILMEKDREVQRLECLVGTAIDRPNNQINNTFRGDTTVSEQGSNAPKYDFSNAQFAGGFAETVQGDQVGGTINNQATDKTSLAEAAAEIQALLKQLEQTAPAETMTEKMTLATQAIAQIEANPTLKQRTVAALTAGGIKAFEKAIDHPVAAFVVGAIEEWKKS